MEEMGRSRVVVVPCSGIGKTYGTVTREAAYVLVEELRPGRVELVPLSLVVLGDEALKARLQGCPAITIDGCNLECARKNVSEAGAVVIENFRVLDVYRRHRHLKPQGIQQLNEGGLARHSAWPKRPLWSSIAPSKQVEPCTGPGGALAEPVSRRDDRP